MKIKITLYITFLALVSSNIILAQKIAPIKMSEQLPDVQFKHIYSKPSETVNLSTFKGKMILIDFWATWCAPCVSSMRHLDSLQSQFGDRLQIICITREDDKTVKEAYNHLFPNKAPTFLTITKDTLLEKYLPHVTIPHCVWADKDGIIQAITDKSSVEASNIRSMLTGQLGHIKNKPPVIQLASHKPPYASKQVSLQDEFLYHSLITKYREDLPIKYSRGPKNDYIACVNSSIIKLYQSAFGKFDLSWLDMNKVICRGCTTFADSASIGLFKSKALTNDFLSNLKSYAFTYELAVSDTVYSYDQLFEIMQQDLNRYFEIYGINGTVEKTNRKILALVTLPGNHIRSYKDTMTSSQKYADDKYLKILGQPISYFISQLKSYLTLGQALVNKTGYQGHVNIELAMESKNIKDINLALAVYGLKIEEMEEPFEVLVITKTIGKRKLTPIN